MLTNKRLKIGAIVKNTEPDLLEKFLSIHSSLPEAEKHQHHAHKNTLVSFLEEKVIKNWALMNDFLLIEGYASGVLPADDLYLFLNIRYESAADMCKALPAHPYNRIITMLLRWQDDVRQHFRLRYYLLNSGKSSRLDRRDYIEGDASLKVFSTELGALKSKLEKQFSDLFEKMNKSGKIVHFDCAMLDNNLHIAVIGKDESIMAEDIKENSVEYTAINPPLYLGVVISPNKKLVEVYAKGASMQRQVHKVIASSLFSVDNLPDHPEHNEVYDTQTIFEKLIQHQKLPLSLPAPFMSIAPKEIVCVRTRPPWNAHTFRVWRVDVKDSGAGLYDELSDFLRVDASSRNTVQPSYLMARKIQFTAFYKDTSQKEQSFDFHIKSNGQTDLHRGELHQALRDALADAGLIREDSTEHPETAMKLMARLLLLVTATDPQYVFTSDTFRYLSEDSLVKLVETGWITFDKHSRQRKCSECGHIQVTEASSLVCNNCGSASVYVLPLNYSISALDIAQAAIKTFGLNGDPKSLINNHLYSLGFSDVSHKHIFLCVAHDGMMHPESIGLISQLGGEAIVLHTGDSLSVAAQNSILFLPILNQMKWTNKGGFEGSLPKVRTHRDVASEGGKTSNDKRFGRQKNYIKEHIQSVMQSNPDWTKKELAEEFILQLQEQGLSWADEKTMFKTIYDLWIPSIKKKMNLRD